MALETLIVIGWSSSFTTTRFYFECGRFETELILHGYEAEHAVIVEGHHALDNKLA